jgi:hypothetical protein
LLLDNAIGLLIMDIDDIHCINISLDEGNTIMAEKKPTWTDVKKVLSEMRQEELINTIADLYKLSKGKE